MLNQWRCWLLLLLNMSIWLGMIYLVWLLEN